MRQYDDYSVDYNQLMRLVKGNLSDNFLKKYFNIPMVSVLGKIKSRKHLLWFLKSLDYLNLKNKYFNQNFFDGLLRWQILRNHSNGVYDKTNLFDK